MKTIVFATRNKGKLREIKSLLECHEVTVLSLNDYPDVPEVVEDGSTFLENALKKARMVSEHTGEWVIADDSGLEVDYLNGRPGVHSSRYSGPDATDDENNRKLLEALKTVPPEKRGAAFRCVLVLYKPDGTYRSFDGELRGAIARTAAGSEGFGYDPVFYVAEYGKTVAELSPDIKNRISHRARAFNKLKKACKKTAIDITTGDICITHYFPAFSGSGNRKINDE